MSDPVEKARLERDARNTRAAFAGAASTRQDSEREELEHEKAAAARRAAHRRDAVIDIALERQQQSRVDAHQARETMIAERRAACTPTATAPKISDELWRELADEARRAALGREARADHALREQAERNR
ncbi:MAG TPA: hypothetical protein VFN67_29905 [Polyangiales bacterium]|nr:hypothetical protein [Polyangiales bacterium]